MSIAIFFISIPPLLNQISFTTISNICHGRFSNQAGTGFALLCGILVHQGKQTLRQGNIDTTLLAADLGEIDSHQGSNAISIVRILLMELNRLWCWQRFIVQQ